VTIFRYPSSLVGAIRKGLTAIRCGKKTAELIVELRDTAEFAGREIDGRDVLALENLGYPHPLRKR
jgi:hypothetical protein